jgi:hypothetical protein
VSFRSKASIFAVCSFCKSTLLRQDMNLTMVGKMSELQDDMSPVQLGSSGMYGGKTFEVIGRLRVAYSDGAWNEWYTIFGGDRVGWLAEAQGFWAMCFSVPDADLARLPERTNLQPGQRIALKGQGDFTVEDIREVVCRYSEGELPVDAAAGRKSTSVDLAGPQGKFATLEYAKDGVRVYVGSYQDFEAFKFRNLREIDGW